MSSTAQETNILNGIARPKSMSNTVPEGKSPVPINISDLLSDYDPEADMDLPDDSNDIEVPFELQLQTEITKKVWNGQQPKDEDEGGHRGYPGIKIFVTLVGKLCRDARASDPYALQSLLNIEQHMAAINTDIENSIVKMEAVLDSNRGNGITFRDVPGRNSTPETYPIVAKNQYSLTAATLVGKYDKAVRYALTARTYNQISRDQFKQVHSKAGPFIKLTFMALSHKYSGTTVEDFLNENEKAQDAVRKYGTIDDIVLQEDFKLRLFEID